MAQTLASGVVIPAPGDRISAAGVQEMRTLGASVDTGLALTQAQTAQTDLQARARDADLADQIAGMEGMTYVGAWEPGRTYRINDVVTHGGDSWARLTAGSQGTPGGAPAHWGLVARRGAGGGFGELAETDVTGLWEGVDSGIAARLAAIEYKSGRRNITARLDPAPVSGNLYIERRGDTVWLHMDALVLTATGFAANLYSGVIAPGFQAAVPIEAPTSPRIVQSLDYPESKPDVDTNIRTYNQVLGFYRVRAGAVVRGMTSWPTNQAIPTTLPGSPA